MKKRNRVAVKVQKEGSSDCNFFSLNDILTERIRRSEQAEHR